MVQPIVLYGHTSGPNPWKVAIILEELKIPYEHKIMDMADLKKTPFTNINVNGRVPAIHDPNTNLTLWESGAIIEYLIETYDKSSSLTYTSFPEKYLVKQWLHFQMSGQGPYFGQAVWFAKFHDERLPSAIERYFEQVKRVLGVLDAHLKEKGTPYLIGDKCTFADLSFVTWDQMIPFMFGDDFEKLQIEKNYPAYYAWNKRLSERPAVQKIAKDKQTAMSAGH